MIATLLAIAENVSQDYCERFEESGDDLKASLCGFFRNPTGPNKSAIYIGSSLWLRQPDVGGAISLILKAIGVGSVW